MTDKSKAPASIAPVSLPAGSYDAGKLMEGLDGAVGAKDADAKIEEAIAGAQEGDTTAARDPALLPDHAFVEVETPFGTERRMVYVPPKKLTEAPDAVDPADLEKQNTAAVRSQLTEAVREGEVAPAPASEPLAAPAGPPPPAPVAEAAPTGTESK
jgi:hypothetical protein